MKMKGSTHRRIVSAQTKITQLQIARRAIDKQIFCFHIPVDDRPLEVFVEIHQGFQDLTGILLDYYGLHRMKLSDVLFETVAETRGRKAHDFVVRSDALPDVQNLDDIRMSHATQKLALLVDPSTVSFRQTQQIHRIPGNLASGVLIQTTPDLFVGALSKKFVELCRKEGRASEIGKRKKKKIKQIYNNGEKRTRAQFLYVSTALEAMSSSESSESSSSIDGVGGTCRVAWEMLSTCCSRARASESDWSD